MDQITRCREEDLPLLLDKFKSVYPANPCLQRREYFDWQFKNSPFNESKEYTFWISRRGCAISGFIGYVPMDVCCNGKTFKGCLLQNWYVEHQDGTGMHLWRQARVEYTYRLLFGNSQNAVDIYQALRLPSLLSFPRYLAVIQEEKVFSLFDIKSVSAREKLRESYCHLSQQNDFPAVQQGVRFDDDEEFFSLEQAKGIHAHIRRNGRYLNWRYLDIPQHHYRFIRGPEQQFVVYRIEQITGMQESVVRILEWNADKGWDTQALAAIRAEGLRHNAILIDFFCSSEQIGRHLMQVGFISSDALENDPIPYLFRPLCPAKPISLFIDMPHHAHHYKENEINFKEWYITKGDGDMDRVKL